MYFQSLKECTDICQEKVILNNLPSENLYNNTTKNIHRTPWTLRLCRLSCLLEKKINISLMDSDSYFHQNFLGRKSLSFREFMLALITCFFASFFISKIFSW